MHNRHKNNYTSICSCLTYTHKINEITNNNESTATPQDKFLTNLETKFYNIKFSIKRRKFDKSLRQEERKYKIQRLNNIKSFNSGNSKEFWREVNKLGPGKTRTNIDCVNMLDGSVSHNSTDILQRWKEEYSNLFSSEVVNVDNQFTAQVQTLNHQLQQELDNCDIQEEDDTTGITEVNESISFQELKRALLNLKNGKATGIDNLPNEFLKSKKLINVLLELFNVCFSNGIVPDAWCQSIICPLLKVTDV